MSLAVISFLMIKNVLKQANNIGLTAYERYACETESIYWIISALFSILSIVLAKSLNGMWITTAGFIYFLLFFVATALEKLRARNEPAKE